MYMDPLKYMSHTSISDGRERKPLQASRHGMMGLDAPIKHMVYDRCLSKSSWIIFVQLAFFNAHPKHGTQLILHSNSIELGNVRAFKLSNLLVYRSSVKASTPYNYTTHFFPVLSFCFCIFCSNRS